MSFREKQYDKIHIEAFELFKKKNLHLVNAAKKFVEEKLNISECPTETKIFISEKKKEIAKKKINSEETANMTTRR